MCTSLKIVNSPARS